MLTRLVPSLLDRGECGGGRCVGAKRCALVGARALAQTVRAKTSSAGAETAFE